MAAALGANPGRIYSLTFGLGAALAGLGGAALAPLTGVIPTLGASYIAKAFITVIGGGSAADHRHPHRRRWLRRDQPGGDVLQHSGVW